jgi:hypothetical protein
MAKSFLKKVWEGLVNFQKRRINAEFNMQHVSSPINLRRPKCKSQLYGLTGDGMGLQLYGCRKCGYQGSIGLPINSKVRRKIKH